MLNEIAAKEIGYKEGANNANKYSQALHKPNESWCVDFVQWVADQAGSKGVLPDTSYCPFLLNWAKENNLIVPTQMATKDDLVLFCWDNTKVPEHIGIVTGFYDPKTKTIPTIEGNTGDPSQNQSNGDGVYAKHRPVQFVVAVFRPHWKVSK